VREARESVFWSLFFIFLLYVTAPAYAVFAKYEVYTNVIGTAIAELPVWVASWGKVGWWRSRTSTATASCNWRN
jgi:cation/acetate symporter